MRKAAAFCPSYITGIFTIASGDAAGAGFAIDKGMETSVSEAGGKTAIRINGRKSSAPVSRAVLKRFGRGVGALEISHKAELPIGFGCGMSAAGAVSLSLALNELLGAGLRREECVKIAHDAEVECGTGLSGADAAAIGGFLARQSVRSAPVKLPFEERKIRLAFFSAIRTSSIIADAGWKRKVNSSGERALSSLFSEKSWERFIACSREFAVSSGLAKWCRQGMGANARASMAMVGRTLFSDSAIRLAGSDFKRTDANAYENGAEVV